MDAEEFLKRNVKQPRSKLEPQWQNIQKLLDAGCTMTAIREFLLENNIEISLPGLTTYIKRRKAVENQKAAAKKEVVLNETQLKGSAEEIEARPNSTIDSNEKEPGAVEESEITGDAAFVKALNPKSSNNFDKYEAATKKNLFAPKKLGEKK